MHNDRLKNVMTEYREVFDTIDLYMEGSIPASKLGEAMQMLGHKPTNSEVSELKSVAETDKHGRLSFDKYVKAITTVLNKRVQK